MVTLENIITVRLCTEGSLAGIRHAPKPSRGATARPQPESEGPPKASSCDELLAKG